MGQTAANFDEWRDDLKKLVDFAKTKQYDDVIKMGEKVRSLYPDYVYEANAYEVLAEAYLAKGNKPAAVEVLDRLREARRALPGGPRKPGASLEEQDGRAIPRKRPPLWNGSTIFYPVHDENLHRHLGELWFAQLNNFAGAIREYSAVLALNPSWTGRPPAQYNLAHAYFDRFGQRDKANEHVLASLEVAPSYRPAQKLLLQLHDLEKGN